MSYQSCIVGCGYVGQRLGTALHALPDAPRAVYGLLRSTRHMQALRSKHIEPIIADLDRVSRHDLSPMWWRNSVLFYLAPPPQQGESDTRLQRFLSNLDIDTEQRPKVLVYLSTTGVYGNTNGATVDESTPINPQTDRARRRASAEDISRVWCVENQVRRVVLRVPAIYGPGRLPLERLRQQEPVVQEAAAPIINRIHVDDLVAALLAAAFNEQAQGIYNVSDGNALSMTAYLQRVAQLANLPAPPELPFEEAAITLSSELLSYLGESRRIDNRRMREELGVTLRYPDVDAGIRASLSSGADQGESTSPK